jgi:hypothetical protein
MKRGRSGYKKHVHTFTRECYCLSVENTCYRPEMRAFLVGEDDVEI